MKSTWKILLVFAAMSFVAGAFYYYLQENPRRAGRESEGPFPIILVSLDTVRADAVSGFGAKDSQTPALLQFGKEGIRFTTAISASHFTSASHATLLTGYSPYVHGTAMTATKSSAIPPSMPTLGTILQKAGYYTAGFTDAGQMTADAGFHRGFDMFKSEASGIVEKLPDIRQFIQNCKDRPFFLFVHSYRAHEPYRPAARTVTELLRDYHGVFAEGVREAAKVSPSGGLEPGETQKKIMALLSYTKATTDAEKSYFRRIYDSGVAGADDEVAELFKLLKETNVYDRSLIIVTSDHGEAFFEHGNVSHRDIYDECIRVPLIFRLPGARHAGKVVEATFPAVNLAPTALELLNVVHGLEFEGKSIARGIESGAIEEEPAHIQWRMHRDDRIPQGFGVRTRNAKLTEKFIPVSGNEPRVESNFFDLVSDPGEKSDLYASTPEKARELKELLQNARPGWQSARKKYLPNGAKVVNLDEDTVGQLQAIGYVK